jgi:hypothetical protein
MPRANNVDTEQIRRISEQIQSDPAKARRTQVIEGEWLLKEGGAQFRSTIKFEGGETLFEAITPPSWEEVELSLVPCTIAFTG